MYLFEESARRARGEREESRATLSRVTLISRTLLLGSYVLELVRGTPVIDFFGLRSEKSSSFSFKFLTFTHTTFAILENFCPSDMPTALQRILEKSCKYNLSRNDSFNVLLTALATLTAFIHESHT